jgi:hypothetical protein
MRGRGMGCMGLPWARAFVIRNGGRNLLKQLKEYYAPYTYIKNNEAGLLEAFSFIRTAKPHGLDPYRYYVKLLKSLPHCQSLEDYEALLP